MEVIDLRQDLIYNINRLPLNMLKELNKFLSFLKYNNYQEEILDNSLNNYMKTTQFQKDKNKLHSIYRDVISGNATLLSEDEYNRKMDDFIANLKMKYADN